MKSFFLSFCFISYDVPKKSVVMIFFKSDSVIVVVDLFLKFPLKSHNFDNDCFLFEKTPHFYRIKT